MIQSSGNEHQKFKDPSFSLPHDLKQGKRDALVFSRCPLLLTTWIF